MLQLKPDEIGCVESTKSASDIYAPISGQVIEVNEKLESQPSMLTYYFLKPN